MSKFDLWRVAKTPVVILCALLPSVSQAQSPSSMVALRGLSGVTTLPNTPEGKAALSANLSVTGNIQTNALTQPTLLPFAEQQRLALRDCFITDGNATELADGLGSKLGAAYQAKARYKDYKTFTNVAPSIADLIGYTNEITRTDSNAGKYFFANATTDGKTPVSEQAKAMLETLHGTTDVFGKSYDRPAGSSGADAFGNSRPFQTEPSLVAFRASDYFARPSHSLDWLRGPGQNLTDSPSYPSGHTTYGYAESVLIAILVPDRYQAMITRGAEYGNDRIIVGAHYAMDVIGGRTLALHDVAHLLANDPAYVGRARRNPAAIDAMGQQRHDAIAVEDYSAAVRAARADLTAFLEAACGDSVASCAAADTGRFKDSSANAAFYDVTQTYGLPVVNQATTNAVEDVGKLAPEAGYLLTAAFPQVTLAEADDILTSTEGPSGGFLDDGSAFGVYSRLNLYAAAGKAASLAATRR